MAIDTAIKWSKSNMGNIGVSYYNNTQNNLSSRDSYIVERYRQLARIAFDMKNDYGCRDIEEIVTGLATIDLRAGVADLHASINELKHIVIELPERMPQPISKHVYDVKVVTDKIQAAMSEFIA